MKKITILGTAYPYRGGLATFIETLARTFTKRGSRVKINTFTVQYPNFLFPGKTQYSESAPPADLEIERCVSTVNPLNWLRMGLRLRRERPDVVIMKYWTPFVSPCLGTIARIARHNKHTKVLVQVDNIVPHEAHFSDRVLTRYFIRSVDGFIYMSQQVKDDLDGFRAARGKPALFSPHPLFESFGERVAKGDACRELGLEPHYSYSLFFGIIRDYKGLDLLLESWHELKNRGLTSGRKLLVGGEFYNDRQKYIDIIERCGLQQDVILHDFFIKDESVRYYFSAADLLIQPYKSATQSGVTQIAYNFELPMVVTNVGGLAEIVPNGVSGYVVEPSVEGICTAYAKFYDGDNAKQLRQSIKLEKERFSWDAMADKMTELYELTRIKVRK